MSLGFFNQGVGLLIKKNLWGFEFGIFLGGWGVGEASPFGESVWGEEFLEGRGAIVL